MIIEALVNLAQRETLDLTLTEPSHSKHIAVHLKKSGSVTLEFVEGRPVRLPQPFSRTSGTRPNLLSDSLPYWAPAFVSDKDRKKKLAKAKREKQEAQRQQNWAAAEDYHARFAKLCPKHDAVTAMRKFFKKPPASWEIPKAFQQAPLVLYYNKVPVAEIPELYDAISKALAMDMDTAEHPSQYGGSSECLLSVHGKVAMPGLGNPQSLIGYDKGVTRAAPYDHEHRMLHAGMPYEVQAAYVAAARWMVAHCELPSVPTNGGRLLYYGWGRTRHRMEEILPQVLYGCPEDMEAKDWVARIQTILDGDEALFEDETEFYIASFLTTNKIMVRDFYVTTVSQLARNLVRYLDDFRVSTKKGYRRMALTPYRILRPLQAKAKKPAFSIAVAEQFYSAIFKGGNYPRELLRLALRSYKDFVVESSRDPATKYPPLTTSATLNAFNRYKDHIMDSTKNYEQRLQDVLNIEARCQEDPYFVLGQLFAVLESRAYSAKDRGDLNPVTREFAKFVQNPGRILARLKLQTERQKEKIVKGREAAHRRHSSAWGYPRERDLGKRITALFGSRIPLRRTAPDQQLAIVFGRENMDLRLMLETMIRREKKKQEEEQKKNGKSAVEAPEANA